MDVGTLDRHVEHSEWIPLAALLRALNGDDLAQAQRWYRRSGRARARRAAELDWMPPSRIVQLLLALTLAETPEEASKSCRWGYRFLWRDDESALVRCADALIQRGPDWAGEFVRLATATTFRGESTRGRDEVTSLVSGAVVAFGLETPLTETYVVGWAALIAHAHTNAVSSNRNEWHPITLQTATRGRAASAYRLSESLTLHDCLAATPSLTSLLGAALDTPNALHEWTTFTEDGWLVPPAITKAIATGQLNRGIVLDKAFQALSRDDRANGQRAIAAVLTGLTPTPTETKDRAGLLLHVLPTVHGSVSKVLLDLALAADLEEQDLLELGTVILARTEKAQKATLVAHLASTGNAAREPLLRMASESPDLSLANKARRLLGDDQPPAPRTDTDPLVGLPAWTQAVTPFHPGSFRAYPATPAGLDEARSDEQTWSRITTEAAYLDLVVRLSKVSLPGLKRLVEEGPQASSYSHVRTPYLLEQWVRSGLARRSYVRHSTSHRFDPTSREPVIEHHTYESVPPSHLLFTDRLVEETIGRLGHLDELLSTPSRVDGTLDVAVLAERVRRARSRGYAPYDLVQALFRLGATTPDDLRLFDGLTLAPEAANAPRASRLRSWLSSAPKGQALDGVETIRQWIHAGGWAARVVDFPGPEPRTTPLTLPLPSHLASLEGVAGIMLPVGTDADLRRPWGSDAPGPALGVCPWDVEHLATVIAAQPDHDSVFHTQRLPLIVGSAGPIGPAVHHHLARLLAHPRLDSRLLAAQHAASLAREGRLDPELLRRRSVALFEHGDLSLPRAVHGWSQLATLSSLGVVWPTWMSVLDLACAAPRKPAGLADLLRATRELAPVAIGNGSTVLPDSVTAIANERGSAKAVVEARSLVSAYPKRGMPP